MRYRELIKELQILSTPAKADQKVPALVPMHKMIAGGTRHGAGGVAAA